MDDGASIYGSSENITDSVPRRASRKLTRITLPTLPLSDKAPSGCTFGHCTRHIVMALSTLCLSLILSNSVTLNFTIICMAGSDAVSGENSTVSEDSSLIDDLKNTVSRYVYTSAEQGWLFSAVAVGNIIGTFPLPVMIDKLGVRSTFSLCGFLSALATLLSPLAAYYGFWSLLVARVLLGLALAVNMPIVGSITSQWAPIRGAGMCLALMTCYLQFSLIVTTPVSGFFCSSSLGWEGIYYLQGGVTVVAFAIFFAFFRDSPRSHWGVSSQELAFITEGKTSLDRRGEKPPVPYRDIFTDRSVIGIWVASVGVNVGTQIFMQFGPIYLNKVLNMDVQSTGFAAAIPSIGAALVKIFAGPFSDRAACVTQKTRVLFFALTSQLGMAACVVVLGWLPGESATVGQACFTLAVVFNGLNAIGVTKSAQLISMQYAHVVMTVIGFINSGAVLVLPFFVSLFAPNNSVSEWAAIFYSIAVILVATIVYFAVTCETDPRPWTFEMARSKPLHKHKVFAIDVPLDAVVVPEGKSKTSAPGTSAPQSQN